MRDWNNLDTRVSMIYDFRDISLNIIFLRDYLSFTFLVRDENLAWQPSVRNNILGASIPTEVYNRINKLFSDKENTSRENIFKKNHNDFFNGIADFLNNIEIHNIASGVDDNTLKNVLSYAKTKDKKYDDQGDGPFYNFARKDNPSKQALDKLERNFGLEIRKLFQNNNMTGVWSDTPTENCLLHRNDFFNTANNN